MAKKSAKSHRELIDTGTDKRFVRRDDQGRFKEAQKAQESGQLFVAYVPLCG